MHGETPADGMRGGMPADGWMEGMRRMDMGGDG